MSEEKLKPCPFCGKEPYVGKTGYAGCVNGDTYMDDKRIYDTCPITGEAMTKEQWNSRPIEDALRKRVEELEAENKKLKKENDELEAEATSNFI